MTQPDEKPLAAVLEHLTGPCRGQYSWITSGVTDAFYGKGQPFRVAAVGQMAEAQPAAPGCVARFRRHGDGYSIEATGACPIWVNRKQVEQADLRHGDMIEFGEDGPLSRLRVFGEERRPDPTISDILGDFLSYMRSSRRPWPVRVVRGTWGVVRRVLFQTTVLFRVGVLVLLSAILTLVIWQWRIDESMSATMDQQVGALARDVERSRAEALRPEDLTALREELSGSVDANRARLATLESQREAATRIIAEAQSSVVFVQAAYGLRHRASGRMLRHQVGPDGEPLVAGNGRPLFTLEGDGPVAEAQITGTGFLVRDTGRLITNRHVAHPWESKTEGTPQEMEPVMVRFQAWFPGRNDPVPVRTLAVSDDADLAVLDMADPPEGLTGLPIAAEPSTPGEAIIVMGYPTGLRSLLAQSGEAFVAGLQADGTTGFWEVAARLAEAGLIAPLSTRGIIGRISQPTVVYDAETTHGGSGGPVLNMNGEVVAVNTAIIPEFGGSNIGVPAAQIRALLSAANAGQ